MHLQTLSKITIMGKIKGSSFKRPHIEETPQEEEENLSKTYKAKFLILSHEEGARLTIIRFREILGYKYISQSLLNKIRMFDVFHTMLNQCGLKKFVSMHEDTYGDLVTEFYATLDVNATNSQIL